MRRDLLYVDSNVFVYTITYDQTVILEARKSRNFLLPNSIGED